MITLITGGVKAGKSSYALNLAEAEFSHRRFLATAVSFNAEMKEKIRLHREERSGRYETIEEPVNIDRVVKNEMIVDCIPMWLNNIFFSSGDDYRAAESKAIEILDRFISAAPDHLIIVTNETGMGNIPSDKLSRAYNTLLGSVNQKLAHTADRVILLVSGCPLVVKSAPACRGGD